MAMLESLLRLGCSLVIWVAWAAFGYALSLRTLPGARSVRWLGAFIVSAWCATAVFLLLGFLRWIWPASLLVSALAAAGAAFSGVTGAGVRSQLEEDARALVALRARVGRPAFALALFVALAYLVLAAASAVSPPLGWDSLHYHFLHVAYWAQDHGFALHPGVDAWGYYQYFPIGGEILWAWVAIPMQSSALCAPFGACLCLVVWLAVACAARTLGATPRLALLAGAALVSTPAVVMFSTNGYVDNAVLAFLAVGVALSFEAARVEVAHERTWLIALSGAAYGLSVGVKPTALPFLALGALAALIVLVIRRTKARNFALSLAGFAFGSCIFVPRSVAVWVEKGSPLYPFPLRAFGHVLSRGNREFSMLLGAEQVPAPVEPPKLALVEQLFAGALRPGWPHLNFGVGGAVLFTLACAGVVVWLARRRRDLRPALLLAIALPAANYFFGHGTLGYRIIWWWVTARLMSSALLAAALLAVLLSGFWVEVVLAVAAFAGLFAPLAYGMCSYRWVGSLCLLLALSLVFLLVWVALRLRRRTAAWSLAAIGVCALGAALVGLRAELRLLILYGAARDECYEGHPLGAETAGAFPVWEYLAEQPARRIAVVAGFDGIGHSVFRYPLLGEHWQHELRYVPPSADGKLRDYPALYWTANGKPSTELSFERWSQRLEAAGISHVVLIRPFNVIEARWLFEHKERFAVESAPEQESAVLFRVLASRDVRD